MSNETARLLDEYLVASAKAGNREALGRLAKRWHPKLLAHAWRLTGNRDSADDAAQTGWSEIIRGIGSLREESAFPSWAYRIVSRTCTKLIADAVHQRELQATVAAEPGEAFAAPQEPSQLGLLQTAIRQLPPGERAAIALYHFEELRVAEVAVALAVPVGTVKTRLMNARLKLRAILEGETS